MVAALLDTNIVVDLLRKRPLADQWLASQSDLGVTRAVWLEVMFGAENRQEQQRAIRLLGDFELVVTTPLDFEWASQKIIQLGLSYKIEPIDYLIAAPAYRLQIPLYTRNLKHMSPLLGTLAQAPY
ncbi:MAG: PIN domain-containing protein [Anaerolineae bacterium]|nr:PIN domain-containing protein [Anaerolineae bacterium]